jgi:hypothetical protein
VVTVRRLTTIAIGALLALALVPASGAAARTSGDATLHVVHGIPKVKVDVCVDGSEVESNFRYGQTFSATLPEGAYRIKVKAAAPGDCVGPALINTKAELTAGLNATAVARIMKGEPGLDVFVNDVSPTDGGEARLTVRHTAKAPKVDVWANGATILTDVPRGASADLEVPEGIYAAWVSAADDFTPVIGPAVLSLEEGMAYQVHAVGTNASNYRFVVLAQDVGTH